MPGPRASAPVGPGNGSVVVLGGGLAGLSAGLGLSRAGRPVVVLEREPTVGGLARTVAHGPFRFDLGGHRFFTTDERVEALLRALMGEELLTVRRRSKILLGGRYLDYPLRPWNALRGLGIPTAARMLLDYARERARPRRGPPVSLEDWVVSRFGRSMFRAYFKEYSEKIWGIGCDRISGEWVEQRIQGLSLGAAIRHALAPSGRVRRATLAEEFLYPALGIGRIAERMREEIEQADRVLTGVRVEAVEHRDGRVRRLRAAAGGREQVLEADAFVSTIPLTALVRMLRPRPPADVLAAAARLRYRDLVVVAVMLERRRVSDQTWLYVPARDIPFGRIHEPTNWSPAMAPAGRTLLVTEHFCFRGDGTWAAPDAALAATTVEHLVRLGLIARGEVTGSAVVRVPQAYPLFDVGYRAHHGLIGAYLGRFRNLAVAGRGGTFKYLNMDHAIAAGLEAARGILDRDGPAQPREARRPVAAVGAGA